MAIVPYDPNTGIKNVLLNDSDMIENLFGLYQVPGATGITKGLLNSLQIFYTLYLNNPRDIYSGINTSGGSGDVYKVKIDENDLEGYLGDKIITDDFSGITFTVTGTTNKTISISLDIQDSGGLGQTLLKDSKTLKRIDNTNGVTIDVTDDVITFGVDEGYLDTLYKYTAGNGIEIVDNVITNVGEKDKFYNDTGSTITAGTVLHLKSAYEFEGVLYPTMELAIANDWSKIQGTLYFAYEDVLDGEVGLITFNADKLPYDTSVFSGAGKQLWLSDSVAGALTETKPIFPSYSISCGGNYDTQTEGTIFANFTTDLNDSFIDIFDGSIRETFDFFVSSDGTTVTGVLSSEDGLDYLTLVLSDGLYSLDVTSSSIALTAGTDTNPISNYVYIPISTKVLTVNTTGFPATEHIKIANVVLQSALTTQSNGGALRNQNINDEVKGTNSNGHLLHITERIRRLNADHASGTEATLNSNNYIDVTAGSVYQLHKQTFNSFSMTGGDLIKIVNDPTTAYRETNLLNTITSYSTGTAWNNEWSNIVVWGICNKTGEVDHVLCNIPSGGYNSEAVAKQDASNFANYNIPTMFKGVGFLIAKFTIRISSGVITYNSSTGYTDLRGTIPNNIAGGSSGGGITDWTGLFDTPSSYVGYAGFTPTVNSSEDGLEFVEHLPLSGGTMSGNIDMDTHQLITKSNIRIYDNTLSTINTNIYQNSNSELSMYRYDDTNGYYKTCVLHMFGGNDGASYIDNTITSTLGGFEFNNTITMNTNSIYDVDYLTTNYLITNNTLSTNSISGGGSDIVFSDNVDMDTYTLTTNSISGAGSPVVFGDNITMGSKNITDINSLSATTCAADVFYGRPDGNTVAIGATAATLLFNVSNGTSGGRFKVNDSQTGYLFRFIDSTDTDRVRFGLNGDIYANTSELVLTENIKADLNMNSYNISVVDAIGCVSLSATGSITAGINSRASHPTNYKAVYQDTDTGEYYTLT